MRELSNKVRSLFSYLKNDFPAKTFFTSSGSLLISFAFIVYNGVLGIMYGAIWNISICIYYLILLVIRMQILLAARRSVKSIKDSSRSIKRLKATYLVLGLLDFSLIVPVMDMAFGNRSYTFGLIPAIAMAAYTTYRLTAGIIQYRKSKRTDNVFVLELRTINMIDALVAVLTLQNALIIANGGFDAGMKKLTLYTSVGILLIIIGVTTASYRKGCQLTKNE